MPSLEPYEESHAAGAEREGEQVNIAQVSTEREHQLVQTRTRELGRPQELGELTERDEDGGPAHEPRHHRVAEQLRHAPQTEHAQEHLHHAHHAREQDRVEEVALTPSSSQRPDTRSDEQAVHRSRTHRELSRGPEERVGEERDDRRVEADLGRETGERRVGHRLRHQHEGDRDSRDEVARPVQRPPVADQPTECREHCLRARHPHLRSTRRATSACLGITASVQPDATSRVGRRPLPRPPLLRMVAVTRVSPDEPLWHAYCNGKSPWRTSRHGRLSRAAP